VSRLPQFADPPRKRDHRALGRCPTQKRISLVLREPVQDGACRIEGCPLKPRHRGLCYSHRKKLGKLGLLNQFAAPFSSNPIAVLSRIYREKKQEQRDSKGCSGESCRNAAELLAAIRGFP